MLPLLNLETSQPTKRENDRLEQEKRKRNEKFDNSLIKKNMRSNKRKQKSQNLKIQGPVFDTQKREKFIDAIRDDFDDICAYSNTFINPLYLDGLVEDSYKKDIPRGRIGNPYMWVITDTVEDGDYTEEVVFGFAFATKTEVQFPISNVFELNLICSKGGQGMKLFNKILRFAKSMYGVEESTTVEQFLVQPVNRVVAQKYVHEIRVVLERDVNYLEGNELMIVLNEDENLHNIYKSRSMTEDEFYDSFV